MKRIICVLAFLALATATPLCEKAADCKDGECCVALTAATASRKGVCIKLRRERQRCSPPESQLSEDFYGGKYLKYCPCQESLECATRSPTKKESMFTSVKKIYRCQKQEATTSGPDKTTAPGGTTTPPKEGTTASPKEGTTAPPKEETTAPEATTEPSGNEDNNEETPDETPDEETPDETPDEETPDEETPNEETPDEETPNEETPDEETPDEETPDEETPNEE